MRVALCIRFLAVFLILLVCGAGDWVCAQTSSNTTESLAEEGTEVSSLPGFLQLSTPDLESSTRTPAIQSTYYTRRKQFLEDLFRPLPAGRMLRDASGTRGIGWEGRSSGSSSAATGLPPRRERTAPTGLTGDPFKTPEGMLAVPSEPPPPVQKKAAKRPQRRLRLPTEAGISTQTLSAQPDRFASTVDPLQSQPLPLSSFSTTSEGKSDPKTELKKKDDPRLKARHTGETTVPGISESSDTKTEKLIKRIEAQLDKGGPGPGKAAGDMPSVRLKSEMLSSQGTASQQKAKIATPGLAGQPRVGSASLLRPDAARFHARTPGDATQRDYSYQYQGPRRYSQGEFEYGNQSSYQGLPYYRRNP